MVTCDWPVHVGHGQYDCCGESAPDCSVIRFGVPDMPVCRKHAEEAWHDGNHVDGFEPEKESA